MRKTVWLLLALVSVMVLGASVTLAHEWRRNASPDCRVGAFMYHAVVPDSAPAGRFDIRHSDFVRHLDELERAGVKVVDPQLQDTDSSTLAGFLEAWCVEASRVALITFDAETPSFHSELSVPPLRDRDMTAAYFVVTGNLDAPGWVDRTDIDSMLGGGMRVGSHSHSHPLMTRVPVETVRDDLTKSITELRHLSPEVTPMLALPGGRYNDQTLVIARSVGFRQVFTSDPCYLSHEVPLYQLCRIEVRGDGGPSPATFLESPFQVSLQGWSWKWKRRVEKLVGERAWGYVSDLRNDY